MFLTRPFSLCVVCVMCQHFFPFRPFCSPFVFSYLFSSLFVPLRPQLQEAKQLERERHRQHSPGTQPAEPDSPQLQIHAHPPAKAPTQEANGPVSPATPSINIPSTPSTPSTPAPESDRRTEPEEQGENPDPENGSEFCVTENEQTEADQATAAAQSTALKPHKNEQNFCEITPTSIEESFSG